MRYCQPAAAEEYCGLFSRASKFTAGGFVSTVTNRDRQVMAAFTAAESCLASIPRRCPGAGGYWHFRVTYDDWFQWVDGGVYQTPSSGKPRLDGTDRAERPYFIAHKEQFAENVHFFRVPYVEWSQWDDDGVCQTPSSHGGYRGEKIALTEKGYMLLIKPMQRPSSAELTATPSSPF